MIKVTRKKSILVIAQFYYPEPFRITDICESLAQAGYEVHVVTSFPNYPEGEIYPEYRHRKHQDEVVNGVRIHRCPVIPRKHGILFRMMNYYSFVFEANRYVRSKQCSTIDGDDFDLVFVNETSPILMAEPAICYSRKHDTPTLLYTLDLWPEWLSGVGIPENSLPFRYFSRVSRRIYRSMDRILVSSQSYTARLHERFAIDDRVVDYLPQYAEDLFQPSEKHMHGGPTHILFAGNIGVMQGMDTVVDAANNLKEEDVIIDIVGDGSELEHLKSKVNRLRLPNIIFHGRHDVSEMPQFYNQADAMLVTLTANPAISLTLPGKVQSYMAAGKPIIGAVNGEANLVISEAQCGYCGPAEDASKLAENIRRFIEDNDVEQQGYNARKYYEKHFTKKNFMRHLTAVIDHI